MGKGIKMQLELLPIDGGQLQLLAFMPSEKIVFTVKMQKLSIEGPLSLASISVINTMNKSKVGRNGLFDLWVR